MTILLELGRLLCSLFLVLSSQIGAGFCSQALFFQNPDSDSVLSKIEELDIENLFIGRGFTGTRYRVRDGKRFVESTVEFDLLKKNVWRCDAKSDGGSSFVTIRDYDFSFNAGSISEGKYEYSELGFQHSVHDDIRRSWVSQVPFMHAVNDVSGNSLKRFVSVPEFKVVRVLDPESHQGCRVEGVEFMTTYKSQIFGELRWFPDNGYLLRSSLVKAKVPDLGERVLQNVTIDYELVNGTLMPLKTVEIFHNGGSSVSQVDEFRDANPDRSFYTAESLGLVTPPRPFKIWKVWALLAFLCVVLAGFCRWRFSKNS